MTEDDVSHIAESTSTALLLALVLAHDEKVDLERLLSVAPIGFMTSPATAKIPEHLQDLYRTQIRDYTKAVLQTALDLRKQGD